MTSPDYPDWTPGQAGVFIETDLGVQQLNPGGQATLTAAPYQSLLLNVQGQAGHDVLLILRWTSAADPSLWVEQYLELTGIARTLIVPVQGESLILANGAGTGIVNVTVAGSNRPALRSPDTLYVSYGADRWGGNSVTPTAGSQIQLPKGNAAVKLQGPVVCGIDVEGDTTLTGVFYLTTLVAGVAVQLPIASTEALEVLGTSRVLSLPFALPVNDYGVAFACVASGTATPTVTFVQA